MRCGNTGFSMPLDWATAARAGASRPRFTAPSTPAPTATATATATARRLRTRRQPAPPRTRGNPSTCDLPLLDELRPPSRGPEAPGRTHFGVAGVAAIGQ